MSILLSRDSSPLADIIAWLEGDGGGLRGLSLMPSVPLEDFVEDGVYVLRAQMPGLEPERDFHVSIDGDQLTIQGERSEMHQGRHRREFQYGSFSRTVSLPAGADTDKLAASYQAGVLELRVPVAEPAAPRRVAIDQAAED